MRKKKNANRKTSPFPQIIFNFDLIDDILVEIPLMGLHLIHPIRQVINIGSLGEWINFNNKG
jgi:hypothetical protein